MNTVQAGRGGLLVAGIKHPVLIWVHPVHGPVHQRSGPKKARKKLCALTGVD